MMYECATRDKNMNITCFRPLKLTLTTKIKQRQLLKLATIFILF